MSLRRNVVFLPNGKGTPFLFGQWRNKAPLKPLQSRNVLVDGGVASRYFDQLWREAFPSRDRLPAKVGNPDGTGTDEFWSVFQ